MKWTNALGTITAVLTLVAAIMSQLLHCTSTGDLAAICTGDIIPAAYMVYASAAFGVITLILKALRPGGPLASLFGPTAVVVPDAKSAPGVVTPTQVASH